MCDNLNGISSMSSHGRIIFYYDLHIGNTSTVTICYLNHTGVIPSIPNSVGSCPEKNVSTNDKYVSLVRRPISVGILPYTDELVRYISCKLLSSPIWEGSVLRMDGMFSNFNDVIARRLPNSVGSVPVSRSAPRSSPWRLDSRPSSEGMEPSAISASLKLRCLSADSCPSSVGIVVLSLFILENSKSSMFVSMPISEGTMP
mmetsp:Transcript_5744/g.10933  ORF Transcript_5744/g.10933 Transcript_5744/m.10933 type:complete len:201 (+) Transcript_5744:118-720(+)